MGIFTDEDAFKRWQFFEVITRSKTPEEANRKAYEACMSYLLAPWQSTINYNEWNW